MKGKASKNRKKGWRRVDTTEVEDFIEGERLQERTGGLVADKSNDELFFIDTPVAEGDEVPIQPNTKKTRSQSKSLKSFANLQPDPRIPAIAKQVKGHVKQNLMKANRPVTKRLVSSLNQRKRSIEEKSRARVAAGQIHQEAYDLWTDDNKTGVDEHYAVVTKRRRVKAPTTVLKKPSAVAAVEAPHPGSSYNPAFDDHQELLQKVVIRQVNEDMEVAKIAKRMKADYGPEGPPTQESYLKEMSQGLGLNVDSDGEAESETEEGSESLSVNPPTTANKMKTKRQKRKRKEMLQELANRKKEKDTRIFEDRNSKNRLRSIKREVANRELLLAERAQKKSQRKELESTQTRRLNKKRYEDMEESVLLTSELRGSLRLTRSHNTLLEERFNSLQKRNIIEPRSRAKFRRKYKPKVSEKKQFKEITTVSRAGGGIIIPFHQRRHGQKE